MDQTSVKMRNTARKNISGLLFAVGATTLAFYGVHEAQAQSPIVIKMATLAPEGSFVQTPAP